MTNKKSVVILAVVIIVLVMGAMLIYRYLSERPSSAAPQSSPTAVPQSSQTVAPQSSPTAAPEDASSAASDFTMSDTEGNSVALSDYFGTPIVLNFWASWCGPCKNEMPVFDAVAEELAGKVSFIMVNLTDGGRETMESASQFIAAQGYTFPVFFDTLSEGAIAYSVRSIPVTYFIDANGIVLAYAAGSMDEEMLRQGIDMILGA